MRRLFSTAVGFVGFVPVDSAADRPGWHLWCAPSGPRQCIESAFFLVLWGPFGPSLVDPLSLVKIVPRAFWAASHRAVLLGFFGGPI